MPNDTFFGTGRGRVLILRAERRNLRHGTGLRLDTSCQTTHSSHGTGLRPDTSCVRENALSLAVQIVGAVGDRAVSGDARVRRPARQPVWRPALQKCFREFGDGCRVWFPVGPIHAFASGLVSPSTTSASKVMEQRLTRNPARANLAILELVLNFNPRHRRTSQTMDPVVPCALRLLSKSTVCQQATRGRLRSVGVLPIQLKYNSPSRRTLTL